MCRSTKSARYDPVRRFRYAFGACREGVSKAASRSSIRRSPKKPVRRGCESKSRIRTASFWPICMPRRSEEHTSELQSLMRISYAVFCLKKKNTQKYNKHQHTQI